MTISLIMCINERGCVGKDNDLLYYIEEDLKRFKKITSAHNSYVFMGEATWKSLPIKPLPNRINVIFSLDPHFELEDKYKGNRKIMIERDASRVINHLTETGHNDKEYFVIGGAGLAKTFSHALDKAYLTIVHDDAEGDTYLDTSFLENFNEVSREKHYDEESGLHYSFVNYTRKDDENE